MSEKKTGIGWLAIGEDEDAAAMVGKAGPVNSITLSRHQRLQKSLAEGWIGFARYGSRMKRGERRCCLCDRSIAPADGICRSRLGEAHYACVPGLGKDLQPRDWDPIAGSVVESVTRDPKAEQVAIDADLVDAQERPSGRHDPV